MRSLLAKKRSFRTGLGVLALLVAALAVYQAPALRVWYRIRQARQRIAERKAEAALQVLKDTVTLAPGNAEVQFWLARTCRLTGRTNEVRSHLDRALQLGETGRRLDREWWLTLAQSGRITEAEPHLAGLLQDPAGDGPAICEAYFHGFRSNLRFVEANGLLDVWQADYPEDPQPHFLRGLCAAMVQRDQLAIEEYEKGLQMEPGRTEFRLRLADMLAKSNEHTRAEPHYRRCLREMPGNADALVGLGNVLTSLGKHEEAAACFREVVQDAPHHFAARLGLGRLAQFRSRPEEALRWLEPLVEEWPGDAQVQYAMAQALQAAGRRDEAEEHLKIYKESFKRLERLEDLFEEIVEHANDVDRRFEIGSLLLMHHSRENGKAWLKSVLQLDPNHREALLLLADYYAKRGQVQRAAEYRQRAGSPVTPPPSL
ncbi:MAG: tetratricopeptide repeat protein [Pirellulaceae bacterium]